jgi:hypothetical protein
MVRNINTIIEKREPVEDSVLEVLQAARWQDDILILPAQLERKTYVAVNKAIESIGGKWNRRAGGHVFEGESNPRELLNLILITGQMPPRNPTAFYPTPQGLAERIAQGIPSTARAVIEPSAGTGSIARAIRDYCTSNRIDAEIHCCEIVHKFRMELRKQGFRVVCDDFLEYNRQLYDAAIMNPPFAVEGDPLAYATHVMHAWGMLAPGGLLRAIVPGGFSFRQDTRVRELRDLVESCGSSEELPDCSFKESGTGVRTVLIELHK